MTCQGSVDDNHERCASPVPFVEISASKRTGTDRGKEPRAHRAPVGRLLAGRPQLGLSALVRPGARRGARPEGRASSEHDPLDVRMPPQDCGRTLVRCPSFAGCPLPGREVDGQANRAIEFDAQIERLSSPQARGEQASCRQEDETESRLGDQQRPTGASTQFPPVCRPRDRSRLRCSRAKMQGRPRRPDQHERQRGAERHDPRRPRVP